MKSSSKCRFCLSTKAKRDISDLKTTEQKLCSPFEIVLFCLDIKVSESDKLGTKLCLKCYRKIVGFYEFKLLAQKNEAFLKEDIRLEVEHKVGYNEEVSIKDEENTRLSSHDGEFTESSIFNGIVKIEPKDEILLDDSHSDDELLSVIKKIKYEYTTGEESKENEPFREKVPKKKKKPNVSQVCEECGKSFRNLKEHLLQHRPLSDRKRFQCKLCPQLFASISARRKHYRVKHLGIKVPCPTCGKVVVNLHQHQLIVHDPERLPLECAVCGRRCISQSALLSHSVIHGTERPHKCDRCEATFRTGRLMQEHIRRVHDKEKPHLCQYCSKSFFKRDHLLIHLRSHTNERPYGCNECGKFFISRNGLKNHQTVHSDAAACICSVCDMAFTNHRYLRAHMLCHTREKKYTCKYCGVGFHRSDHRKRHEFTAHERNLPSTAA